PSTLLVLYAILSGVSVAAILVAGIIPGVITAIAYALYILARARKMVDVPASMEKALVSAGHEGGSLSGTAGHSDATSTKGPRVSLREPLSGLVKISILFSIILGGIYSGYFTVTESAAMGALAAMVMLFIEIRNKSLRDTVREFVEALKETASTTSMVFAVIVGSGVLSTFFVAARLPETISVW